MNFFQTLESQFPDADLTIRVKAKEGIYSISVMPCSNNKNDIQPLIVSGSPEELDAQFFELIKQPLENTIAAIVNLEEQKSSVTASTEKQAPAKKAAPAKVEAKKTTAKKDMPAPVEGSLFEDDDQPEVKHDDVTVTDQEGTQDDEDQNDEENND